MIDRDQLREALAWYDDVFTAGDVEAQGSPRRLKSIVEAARLVADPDTLIITKVDGKWPYEARRAFMESMVPSRDVDGWLTPRGMDNALDALLEQSKS